MPARIIETNESPLNPIEVDGITVDLIENALKNAREEMDALVSRTALSPGSMSMSLIAMSRQRMWNGLL